MEQRDARHRHQLHDALRSGCEGAACGRQEGQPVGPVCGRAGGSSVMHEHLPSLQLARCLERDNGTCDATASVWAGGGALQAGEVHSGQAKETASPAVCLPSCLTASVNRACKSGVQRSRCLVLLTAPA